VPVWKQLAIFLYKLSDRGITFRRLAAIFGVSEGHSYNCILRSLTAINSLSSEYIRWPDVQERQKIAADTEREFGFPSCVGLIDGTDFEIFQKPVKVI
jgi:hypothetical protein